MSDSAPVREFASLHQHGLVRVAAATPVVATAIPPPTPRRRSRWRDRRTREGVDLVVFPETGPVVLRDRRPAACRTRCSTRSRTRSPTVRRRQPRRSAPCCWSARRCAATAGSTTRAVVDQPRPRSWASCPRPSCPTTANTTRSAGSPRAPGRPGGDQRRRRRRVPFGTDLIFAAADLADFTFGVEICEDFWAPTPPSTTRALAGAPILCNLSASNITVGKAADRAALSAAAVGAGHRRLCLLRRRARREHHRPGLGRPGHGPRTGRAARRVRALRRRAAAADRRRRPRSASGSSACARRRSTTPPPRRPARAAVPHASASSTGRTAATSGCGDRCAASPSSPPIRRGSTRTATRRSTSRSPRWRRRFQRRRRPHGDRRLRRARFDPRADRRRQGLRPARGAALVDPRLTPCRASPPARRPRPTPGR